jgi:hypothetical protein
MATGKFAHFFTFEFVYTEGAAWTLAAVLHMIVRLQLRSLEEWASPQRQSRVVVGVSGSAAARRGHAALVKTRAFRSLVLRAGCYDFLDMPFATRFALESI